MTKDTVPVVTPIGELWYVNITGKGKENYNQDGFDYVSTIYLTGDKAKTLIDKIHEVVGEVPKGKTVTSCGYRELLEDAEGRYTPTKNTVERDAKAKKTGIFAFTFKTGATFPDGRPAKVAVYNSAAQKVEMGDRYIGNGSKGAISGKIRLTERGPEIKVSLFLTAIQLTEYVAYTPDAGFDEQPGTFTAPSDGETGFTGNDEGSPALAVIPVSKPRL